MGVNELLPRPCSVTTVSCARRSAVAARFVTLTAQCFSILKMLRNKGGFLAKGGGGVLAWISIDNMPAARHNVGLWHRDIFWSDQQEVYDKFNVRVPPKDHTTNTLVWNQLWSSNKAPAFRDDFLWRGPISSNIRMLNCPKVTKRGRLIWAYCTYLRDSVWSKKIDHRVKHWIYHTNLL